MTQGCVANNCAPEIGLQWWHDGSLQHSGTAVESSTCYISSGEFTTSMITGSWFCTDNSAVTPWGCCPPDLEACPALVSLQTVFNFSSASHSLLSVFRALSGAHGSAIAAKSKDAVAQQVAVLLPMAEEIGPVCVPNLPADVRAQYSKQVLVVQGLVALTSAVARNVSAMLPQVGSLDIIDTNCMTRVVL